MKFYDRDISSERFLSPHFPLQDVFGPDISPKLEIAIVFYPDYQFLTV